MWRHRVVLVSGPGQGTTLTVRAIERTPPVCLWHDGIAYRRLTGWWRPGLVAWRYGHMLTTSHDSDSGPARLSKQMTPHPP